MKIRLPNTEELILTDIDMSLFIVDREFEKEIFGWYNGQYISVLKNSI